MTELALPVSIVAIVLHVEFFVHEVIHNFRIWKVFKFSSRAKGHFDWSGEAILLYVLVVCVETSRQFMLLVLALKQCLYKRIVMSDLFCATLEDAFRSIAQNRMDLLQYLGR